MDPEAPTFLGLPRQPELDSLNADIAILGVPTGVPYPSPGLASGCAEAPRAIRERSLRFARFLGHHDFDLNGPLLEDSALRIVDCGDVATPAEATAAVRTILDLGAVPIVLGGDDSIPIPVLRAYEGRTPITVVQIDAHLDFRDEVDGVREGYSSPMRRASEMEWVERILQVGLRGVGSARSGDVADAEAAGNVLIAAREVHRLGVETVFDRLPEASPCFISLDCDALDPSLMPAVAAPMPGGLSFDQAADLLRGVAARAPVVGMALTEMVPALDVNGVSALTGVRLIANLIGAMARSGQITPANAP